MKKPLRYIASGVLAMFGLVTLFLSSSIIFDWFGIREKEGHFVLLIVWANFICSWIYLVSAVGLIKGRSWTATLLVLALAILLVAFAGLFVHIQDGGLYETKTVGAMGFRMVVTLGFAAFAYFSTRKESSVHE